MGHGSLHGELNDTEHGGWITINPPSPTIQTKLGVDTLSGQLHYLFQNKFCKYVLNINIDKRLFEHWRHDSDWLSLYRQQRSLPVCTHDFAVVVEVALEVERWRGEVAVDGAAEVLVPRVDGRRRRHQQQALERANDVIGFGQLLVKACVRHAQCVGERDQILWQWEST